jgi:hypothetical protein
MIHLDPGDPPALVARLPEYVPLPYPWCCRDVLLAHSVLTHIVERRLTDGDAQVSLVLRSLHAVLSEPTHWGRLTSHPQRLELYRRISWDDPAGVLVSVKFVHAGETWVNTAHPVGVATLVKHLKRKRLLLFREAGEDSGTGG